MSRSVQLALPLADPILVRCVLEGTRCRVRPCSAGLDPTLNCAFPRHLREANALYAVGRISLIGYYYWAFKPFLRLA